MMSIGRPAHRSHVPPVLALLILGATCGLGRAPETAAGTGPYPAISRPSELRELAVAMRGRVDRVTVDPGDEVHVGDELLALEDAVQMRTIDLATLSANDDSAVRNALLTRDYWAEEVRLTKDSLSQGGASETELRDALHKLGQAELALEASRRQHEESQVELARERARLDEMRVVCPIDGRVLEVHKRKGETADEQTKVITVVSINPLWLEVNVPTRDALGLASGQTARVRWQDVGDAMPPMEGRVVFVSPAGHAGARQIQVRVEVPNPAGFPSGLHGDVWFGGALGVSGPGGS